MGTAKQTVISHDRVFGPNHPEHHAIQAILKASERANTVARHLYEEAQRDGEECLGAVSKNEHFSEVGFEDVVTKVDEACDEILKEELVAGKDIPILSEETVDHYADDAKDGDQRWLIDPIDGTYCLKNGMPDFSITIALQQKVAGEWKTQVGAVSIPMHDEVYLADERSAHLIQDNREKRLRVRGREQAAFEGSLDDAIRDARIESVIYKKGNDEAAGRWMQTRANMTDALGDAASHTYSTAIMVAKIADGWMDGAIIASNALDYAWDTDAAIHIAQKAGAKVKRYELDGEPVVLVANSHSLLAALERTLGQEYQKAKSGELTR